MQQQLKKNQTLSISKTEFLFSDSYIGMAHTSGGAFWKEINPTFRNNSGRAITQGLQTYAMQKGLTWSMGVSAVNGNGKMILTLYIAFL